MEVYTVAKAKDNFSKLRRLAAKGNEFIVVDHKRAETAPVSVIATELLDKVTNDALASLTYEWLNKPGDIKDQDEVNQTWNLWNHQLKILGVGITKEEAILSLAKDVINYANEYFDDLVYFLNPRSERDGHYWILRGIKQCEDNSDKAINIMGLNKLLED